VVFRFERIRGFRVDLIECLHELEDLGVEHAVNLVESECSFFLVVLETILGYGRSWGVGLRGRSRLGAAVCPHTPSTFLDSEQHGSTACRLLPVAVISGRFVPVPPEKSAFLPG